MTEIANIIQEMCKVVDIMVVDDNDVVAGASDAVLGLLGLTDCNVVGRPLLECTEEMNATYFRGLRYGDSPSILTTALNVARETGWFEHVCWLADPAGRTARCNLLARKVPAGIMIAVTRADDQSNDKQITFLDRKAGAVETRSGERYDWQDLEILTEIVLGKSIIETAETLGVTEGKIRYRLGKVLTQSGINDVGELRETIASWYVDSTFPSPSSLLNGFPYHLEEDH